MFIHTNVPTLIFLFLFSVSLKNIESRYSPAQKAVVLVFSRSVDVAIEKGQDMSSSKGSPVVARLVVPTNQVGCVLGKGGVIISEIRKVTGTNIRIISSDQVPKCAAENDEIVQVRIKYFLFLLVPNSHSLSILTFF